MSITIDTVTAERLRRYARRERRPVSQVVEMSIEKLIEERAPEVSGVVTTRGSFKGKISREDSYGER